MKRKHVYLLLSIAGAVLPYTQFIPGVLQHGLDMRLFIQDLFVNRVSAFFALDVLVSAIVIFVFAGFERSRNGSLWWTPIVAACTVGVSLALPLLLYLRERREALQKAATA